MENYIGAIYGLPNNTYHEHSALGASGFKLLNRTPAHYYARYLDPNREIKPQTESQRIGTMIHTATLEPHKFDEQFIVLPEGLDRRTKEGKALWDEIIASGKEPLKPDDLKLARATSGAIHAHPLTRILFDQCDADTEVSLFANDPETGVLIKIRTDIIVEPCDMFPNGLIVDVKSTDDASPSEFGRSVWNWEMYYQAALYPRLFMQVFNTDAPPSFIWCAVEKSAPYAVKYHNCTEALTDYGNMQVDRLLDVYAECIASGVWPGYDTEVSDIVLPAWAENIILGSGEDDIKEISYV